MTTASPRIHRPCPCPICGRRPVRVGCVTCGNSFCQESSCAANALASGRRLSAAARRDLQDRRDRAADSARAWGTSR